MPLGGRAGTGAAQVLASAIHQLSGSPEASARYLREVFERSSGFIALLAPDGMILEANPAALLHMGADREALVGIKIWDAPAWSDSAKTRSDIRSSMAAAARGVVVHHEVEIATGPDPVTLDLSITPITDPEGRVVLIMPEGRDVTLRKRADDRLRDSEERLNRIVAIAADAIISIDEAQRITLFNHGAEQIFGYKPSEVLGQPMDILLPKELARGHQREVEDFASSSVSARRMGERREIFGRRKTGEVFRAEASISKFVVSGKTVFTAVLRDVTERWARDEERTHLLGVADAAREQADRARERMAFLAEVSESMAETLDFDHALQALARLLVPRIATLCLIDIIDEDGRPRRVEALHASDTFSEHAERLREVVLGDELPFMSKTVLSTGEPELIPQMTEEHLLAASQLSYLEVWRAIGPRSVMKVPLSIGDRTLGALTLVRDSSAPPYTADDLLLSQNVGRRAALGIENARLYRRSREASEQRDHVLRIVSHDLRNPIAAMTMCVAALEGAAGEDSEDRARMLATINDSLDLMHRLIDDLLDISSIEKGRLSFSPRPTDPMVAVIQVFQLFEQTADAESIRLKVEVPELLPRVRADGGRLVQALANLVTNAIKFTPRGGDVSVMAMETPDGVTFSVSDTGAGIPSEQVPHVFDRFWLARRDKRPRGTGLGLAITKGIVEAHGGRIWIESALGKGTTVRFHIPLSGELPDRPSALKVDSETVVTERNAWQSFVRRGSNDGAQSPDRKRGP